MFVVGYTEEEAPYGHVQWTGIGGHGSADDGRESIPNDENLKPSEPGDRGESKSRLIP
jgi:hypothetical protein